MNAVEEATGPKTGLRADDENELRVLGDRFRSPRPYHRRSSSLTERPSYIDLRRDGEESHAATDSQTSSADSGTEADDEKGHFLKLLPAPRGQPNKGLIGGPSIERTPIPSPLLTPPARNNDDKQLSLKEARAGGRKDLQEARTVTSDYSAELLRKYNDRKRREVARRGTEVSLLIAITALISVNKTSNSLLLEWRTEAVVQALLWAVFVVAYPVRLAYNSYSFGLPWRRAVRIGFHIPSSFEPAPLLYPIFLPLLIAVTLMDRSADYLLPNIIMGLCSMPLEILPWRSYQAGFDGFRWLISVIPLFLFDAPLQQSSEHPPWTLKLRQELASPSEMLALVPVLHQSLVPTIEYLTTSSLDPSELQLLTTLLINILIASGAPQMQIAKALLWLGGLLMFLCCKRVMSLEVQLARVPSWRLRNNANKKSSNFKWYQKIDRYLCQKLAGRLIQVDPVQYDDSDDETELPPLRKWASTQVKTLRRQMSMEQQSRNANGKIELSRAKSQVAGRSDSNKEARLKNQRRHTFGASDGDRSKLSVLEKARDAFFASVTQLTTLTLAQAFVRKWLFALWSYVSALAIILGPIRIFVARLALGGQEPFGWALSYLFGQIPQFRRCVVYNNLEWWIPLPRLMEKTSELCHHGWVEHIRQVNIGPANVRLILCTYCLLCIATGLAIVLRLSSTVEVDTRRKVFHGVMVFMLLPTIFVDPSFASLALLLVLAIFLLLDLFRAAQIPPISRPLTYFLAPYVDGRDHRGPVIVSHIFLLIGCAIPLWLSLAGVPRIGEMPWQGWDVEHRELSMITGVICVGMGDAAASLVGRRYGRHKWYWSGGKTLEGSAAFATAVTIGLLVGYAWLYVGGWSGRAQQSFYILLTKALVAGSGASLLESVLTGANDNVVVPVVLWLLVKGLQI